MLLYDFICSNNLVVSNFEFKQNVNYSYFKGDSKTYIDHCLVTCQTRESIVDCKILSEHPDCASDHYPVSIILKVSMPSQQCGNRMKNSNINKKNVNWNDKSLQQAYSNAISALQNDINVPVELSKDASNDEVQSYIDSYHTDIVNVMHTATETAMASVEQPSR